MSYLKTFVNVFKNKAEFWLLTIVNMFVSKDNKSVYIFDEGFKKDNVWEIARELSINNDYSDYVVHYYIGENNIDVTSTNRLIFITDKKEAFWLRLKSKYVFHSYMEMKKMKPVRGQVIVNTMHGSPLKRIGYMESTSRFKYLNVYRNAFNYILCQSEFFKEIIKESFGVEDDQCLILGYPRNDALFRKNNSISKLSLDYGQKKTIVWMPTWRRDKLTQNNNDSSVEFPVLTIENISGLNELLKNNNTMMLIKPHPFQVELDIFSKEMSNIKVVTNKDLFTSKVNLYSLLGESDSLLTDYSSVYFDYLILDKPIGFTIDDFSSYEDKRGFVVDNPLEIMPGMKIYSIEDLERYIVDLSNDNDAYATEREKVNELANRYNDDHSAKRVLERIIK